MFVIWKTAVLIAPHVPARFVAVYEVMKRRVSTSKEPGGMRISKRRPEPSVPLKVA